MRALFTGLAVLCTTALIAQWDLLTTPVTQDRFIIQFTNDFWLDAPDGIEFRPYSPGLTVSIMHDYGLGDGPLSVAWGYGFSSHNVHSNAEFRTDTIGGTSQSILTPFADDYDFDKNKLSVNYLEIPLEFRIRTGKRKEKKTWEFQADPEKIGPQFNLAIGAKVGYAINVHTKTIDDQGKRKFYGVDHLQPLRYGVTARVGFGSMAVTGFYALNPLIKEGEGTQVVPVSVGLAWLIL